MQSAFPAIRLLISRNHLWFLQLTCIGATTSSFENRLSSKRILNTFFFFFSFSSWLDYLPLQTTERALHLVHPGSRHWSFVLQSGDLDDAHFKYYAWELAPCIPSTSGRKTTAIVMAMPPWTLTPTDLQCFAACREARTSITFSLNQPPDSLCSFHNSAILGVLAFMTINAYGERLVFPF